jgi:hypothetical protein
MTTRQTTKAIVSGAKVAAMMMGLRLFPDSSAAAAP